MALYRCEVKHVGRASGRSAVAAAAYRAREAVRDERQGRTFAYQGRAGEGPALSFIEAPYEWAKDRVALWNAAEAAEKRKDARTASEVLVALPRELSPSQSIMLLRSWVRREFVSRGLAVDVSIHRPKSSDGDEQPHAHILLTTRAIESDRGKLAAKKDRDLLNGPDAIEAVRASWGTAVNNALTTAASSARVTHLSRAKQAVQIEKAAEQTTEPVKREALEAQAAILRVVPPEPKLGPTAAALERRGIPTHAGRDMRAVRDERRRGEALVSELLEVGRALVEVAALGAKLVRAGMGQVAPLVAKRLGWSVEDVHEHSRRAAGLKPKLLDEPLWWRETREISRSGAIEPPSMLAAFRTRLDAMLKPEPPAPAPKPEPPKPRPRGMGM